MCAFQNPMKIISCCLLLCFAPGRYSCNMRANFELSKQSLQWHTWNVCLYPMERLLLIRFACLSNTLLLVQYTALLLIDYNWHCIKMNAYCFLHCLQKYNCWFVSFYHTLFGWIKYKQKKTGFTNAGEIQLVRASTSNIYNEKCN